MILSQDQTLVKNLFSGTLSDTGLLSYSVSSNDSFEFYANFIVHVLTLKGLETDTLYLVFKDRIPNCLVGLPYGQPGFALSNHAS